MCDRKTTFRYEHIHFGTALIPFSDAMIAVQTKYNLVHCNTIKNSAGRRVWGFTGVAVITKPSYTDGFMDASQCTYVPKEWTN